MRKSKKIHEAHDHDLWDAILQKIEGQDSKWEDVVDLMAEVWNGGFQQWIEHGKNQESGRSVVRMLQSLGTDAGTKVAELTQTAMSSDFAELVADDDRYREAASEEDGEYDEMVQALDELDDAFYNGLADQLVADIAKKLGVSKAAPESESPAAEEAPKESKIRENWKARMKKVNEREWKYRIDLGFLDQYTMGDEDLDDAQAGEVGAKCAEVIRKVAEEVGESNPDLSGQLDSVAGMFQDAASVEDLDQALEDLYEIGDHYSVWVNASGAPDGEGDAGEMAESKKVNESHKINEWVGKELEQRNQKLFKNLVPTEGAAETVEGELLRAANRIIYCFFNDGDVFYDGYGIETAGPAYMFLKKMGRQLRIPGLVGALEEANGADKEQYKQAIQQVLTSVLTYIESKNGQYSKNTEDIWDYQEEAIQEFGDPDQEDDDYGGRDDMPDSDQYEEDEEMDESKVNEDTGGAESYHRRLFAFLDHPWQEDSEIELVQLISEYRDQFKVNPPAPIQDYLKRLVQGNQIMGRQGFSDEFMNQLQDLMGTDPGKSSEEVPAEEVPPNESKKVLSEKGLKVLESIEDIRSFRQSGILSNNNGLVIRLNDGTEFQVTIVQSEPGDTSEQEMEDLISEALFEKDEREEEDAEDFEDDQDLEDDEDVEEPVESRRAFRSSVQTARNLLGLKEKSAEDEPVKVGDLVQIVDANSFRVEVEEATVKALDEKRGVEITGSTVPSRQKWYGKPFWFVSKL